MPAYSEPRPTLTSKCPSASQSTYLHLRGCKQVPNKQAREASGKHKKYSTQNGHNYTRANSNITVTG